MRVAGQSFVHVINRIACGLFNLFRVHRRCGGVKIGPGLEVVIRVIGYLDAAGSVFNGRLGDRSREWTASGFHIRREASCARKI